MSRTLALTFLVIPLIAVHYTLGACILNPAFDELKCTGGNVSDLKYHEGHYLRRLFIENMSIPMIKKHAFFSNLSSRENFIEFSCSSCEIEIIKPKAFRNFAHLQTLNLRNNRLRALKSSWLPEINRIKILDLMNNNIEYIADEAFDYLRELKKLNLRNNKIKTLKFDMMNSMVELEWLDLSENPLNNLNYIFKFFRAHQRLNMYWTNINNTCSALKDDHGFVLEYHCMTGNILDFTTDPGKVQTLGVFGMRIPILTNETFSGFSNNLMKLKCLFCKIGHIQPNALGRFPKLIELKLTLNQLKTFEASYLKGLEGLKILKLDYNQIESIDDNVYDQLREVEKLNLNGNQLECLNVTAMAPMKKLHSLFLKNNPNFKCTADVSEFMKSHGGKIVA